MNVFAFGALASADLIVDAIYNGGSSGNTSDDPISRLLKGSGNQGGFRAAGRGDAKHFVVLYTSGEEQDWPDRLDLNTGQFVYYGDNRTPGHELHDTQKGGNCLLRRVFDALHASPSNRGGIPPFFIFKKFPNSSSSRSVQFKGIAVPGFAGLSGTEDLVAIWKSVGGQRFQNYRSVFTVLNVPVVDRSWIERLASTSPLDVKAAPKAWRNWVQRGAYEPLTAEPTTVIRSIAQQAADTPAKGKILQQVWMSFKDSPFAFEAFAARIYQMTDPRVIIDEITRGSVDGGRDAIGRYLLGLSDDPVYVEFSLEAKCYRPPIDGELSNAVGVKEVSRLISRLRHRQFGVLVTTSVVARQAYEEVREDRHPIVFIAGRDIAEILIKNGYTSPEKIEEFIRASSRS